MPPAILFLIPFLLLLLPYPLLASSPTISFLFNVSYLSLSPLGFPQQVIGINGLFPGPQINASTDDLVNVTVLNNLDEPFLLTWDGVEQRGSSWQDGVSGTTCPIPPGSNWTYAMQFKDQIGSFFYFPTTLFQKAAGGFGSIRINNDAPSVPAPFLAPDDDFVLLVGDWYTKSHKDLRGTLDSGQLLGVPNGVLMNGKGPYNNNNGVTHEVFTVRAGFTYRFRVSNVGIRTSLNLRIQSHKLHLVEIEGSYVQQQNYDSLDIHVGQSYSFLLTADQLAKDYYIVASPRVVNITSYTGVVGIAILHYSDSSSDATGPLPEDPGTHNTSFSIDQARSIRWNLTAGAARSNPQGSFRQGKIPINDTVLLQGSAIAINNKQRFAVNGRSYVTPDTPLKLADFFNRTGVFQLGSFPTQPVNTTPTLQTSVIMGKYRAFTEFVFINDETDRLQSWHIDGYAVFVVGMGRLPWTDSSRSTYNRKDAVSRMTVQVYPQSWTAVLTELDNVGMWNIRSEALESWYLGEELYMRVHNPESNITEKPIPSNALMCGKLQSLPIPQNKNPQTTNASHRQVTWMVHVMIAISTFFFM